MTGDFSRWRADNARRQGYSGVLMQQGRLYTDSDWNENLAILNERAEHVAARLIGASGTPKEAPGFTIAATASGGFSIGAGSYWVDGLRVENQAATSYAGQGGGLNLEPLSAIPNGTELLIYLVAGKDQVSALADPLLADPALSGVDTTVRERAHWRVGVRPLSLSDAERQDLLEKARCGRAPDFPDWRPSTGRMRAGTAAAPTLTDDDDCLIPPDSGYLSQENQLYRVRIVRGGTRAQARFVWSRENGSVEARLTRNLDGQFVLEGARDDEALGFASGGFVELYDDRDTALGRPGFFTRITLADGIASFTPAPGDFAQMVNPRLRRWDHGGSADGLPLSTAPTPLERGIEVGFTDGSYAAGDAWMFEARAATGQVVWPPFPAAADAAVPPMSWGRRYAPLALARRSGNGIADLVDLRAKFPALSCLQAEDVRFDNSNCNIDAENVQQALEALCRRGSGGGLCTAVVRTSAELIAAVQELRDGQSLRLCLAGAAFQLPTTLRFSRLGHIVVEGTGPQTIISVADGEAALLFEACASVQVRDLAVNGGPNGQGGRQSGRRGALTMLGCGDVTIERVRARCRSGLDRASSCISSVGRLGRRQEVRIRDCTLKAGQAQIGVQIVGASRCIVENNLIQPLPATTATTLGRIAADRLQRLRIARNILRFSALPETASPLLAVLSARRAYSNDAIDRRGTLREAELEFPGEAVQIRAYHGQMLALRARRALAGPMIQAVLQGSNHSRAANVAELRRHLRNLAMEAAANRGRARIGGNNVTLFPGQLFQLAETPFLAQGIVVGGDRIDEVWISGNRIEDANDGIRIAASGRQDPNPPRWRDAMPPNRAAQLWIDGNSITLNPLSNVTPAHGIFLGHAAQASISRNSVTLARVRQTDAPHFGIRQQGWRGPLLSIVENHVTGMENGIAVVSTLSANLRGMWRLRDNAAFGTGLAYVTASGVDVVA